MSEYTLVGSIIKSGADQSEAVTVSQREDAIRPCAPGDSHADGQKFYGLFLIAI